jgi:hypothetical protein
VTRTPVGTPEEEPQEPRRLNMTAMELLARAADLAHSIAEDDRETAWCEDVEDDIREAMRLLKEADR